MSYLLSRHLATYKPPLLLSPSSPFQPLSRLSLEFSCSWNAFIFEISSHKMRVEKAPKVPPWGGFKRGYWNLHGHRKPSLKPPVEIIVLANASFCRKRFQPNKQGMPLTTKPGCWLQEISEEHKVWLILRERLQYPDTYHTGLGKSWHKRSSWVWRMHWTAGSFISLPRDKLPERRCPREKGNASLREVKLAPPSHLQIAS